MGAFIARQTTPGFSTKFPIFWADFSMVQSGIVGTTAAGKVPAGIGAAMLFAKALAGRRCPLLDQSGQRSILARSGLVANDPKRTSAAHCGNGFEAAFSHYQSTRLNR
jgi:hypothetical protein